MRFVKDKKQPELIGADWFDKQSDTVIDLGGEMPFKLDVDTSALKSQLEQSTAGARAKRRKQPSR